VQSIVLIARSPQDLDYVADTYLLPREVVEPALRFYAENNAEIAQYPVNNDDPGPCAMHSPFDLDDGRLRTR
jgi:hypothetical protein